MGTTQKQAVDVETPEFLERLQKFDPEAFRTLFQTFHDRMYNLAFRMLHNAEDAEEVLQEAFLSIFDKIGTFQGKSKLSTWIYVVTSNAALTRIRKNQSRPVTYVDESNLKDKSLFRNEDVVFQIESHDPLVVEELKKKLDDAITMLPDGYREIFIMREVEKIPVKEIARVVGINEGAVKTRLHRSRLMLRARLSDYRENQS